MSKVALTCRQCGHRSLQWLGRCPQCEAWESFVAAAECTEALVVPMGEVVAPSGERVPSGLAELDRVLGGGLVRGSVVLLAGEPGVGKSTLLLQLAAGLQNAGQRVLVVCGEESLEQVAARGQRLLVPPRTALTATTAIPEILPLLVEHDVVLVDSIQTVRDPEAGGEPGSVTQVRQCASVLTQAARACRTAVILVGHICKDGSIAGPRALEHVVDVVITFEGDQGHVLRTVRGIKNRFGATGEIGVFQMGQSGLIEVPDASSLLLRQRCSGVPGSAVGCILEGRRPLALEIQTLVIPTPAPVARRVAQGLESARLGVALAVLEQRAGLKFCSSDVYASVAGGLRAVEPGIDLALALALASSRRNRPVPPRLAAIGEVGLAGDIRMVAGIEARVAELSRLGFGAIAVPMSYSGQEGGLVKVRDLQDALRVLEVG
ncbi:MAG: DNA repair protein RadA [Actinomycetota bacterium]